MKQNWKNRLFLSFIGAISAFICSSVVEKLLMHNEDWLVISILLSVVYGISCFIAISVDDKQQSRFKMLVIDLIISIIAYILLAFALGVIGDMPDWAYYTNRSTTYLIISLILNNVVVRS